MIPFTIALPWQNWWNVADKGEQQAVFDRLASDGVRHLVLTPTQVKEYMTNPSLQMQHCSQMSRSGLTFVDSHAPYGLLHDLSTPLPEYHALMLERQKMALRICHLCGVHTMTFHAGNIETSVYGSHLRLEDYYAMFIHSLEELLPVAQQNGVIMALENIWVPLTQTSMLLKVIRHFNTPWLGLCYDSGHANLTQRGRLWPDKSCVPYRWAGLGLDVGWEEDIIQQFQPYVINCHLHDNNGQTDQHALPGKGTVDWAHIMPILLKAPNLQNIQSEVAVKPDGPSIRQLLDVFGKLLP